MPNKINNNDIIKNKHGWIDVSNIDKTYKGNDWANSIEKTIKFKYNDIIGIFKIVKYIKGGKLVLKYNNKDYEIASCHLLNGEIGRILGVKNKEYKYEIGEEIQDDKKHIIITDKTKKDGEKAYAYKCLNCGFTCTNCYDTVTKKYYNEYFSLEYNLIKKGCPCCSGRIVSKDINSIYSTDKLMFNMLLDTEYGYVHTINSGIKTKFKCLNCGKVRTISPNMLISNKFSCPNCGDGLSYGEKYISNLLTQLLGNNYIWQLSKTTFKWCDKYRYDFYFEHNNEKYIIEVHGEQHYKGGFDKVGGKTCEEEKENDKIKYKIALLNGIKECNYIIIDCFNIQTDIKTNIINSKLNKIFNLSIVDWNECEKNALKNLIKEVCDYWNIKNYEDNTSTLSEIFKLSPSTILNYLKKGTSLGWCKYNSEDEINKRKKNAQKESIKALSKLVEVLDDQGNLIGKFSSYTELSNKSYDLLGVKLDRHKISQICNGNYNTYKNFIIKNTNL